MPNLSPKEYAELQRLITGPDHGLTPEELERANAAVAGFNEQYEAGMRGGLDPEAAMAMGPPTQADPNVSREIPGGEDLALKLDPAFPLLPQADATAPATTHPGGDMQAAMEWMGGQPGGDVTFVYEPPLEVAQQKLLENPQLARTLFENLPDAMSPEAIAKMQKGDDAYERVANRMWADTAKAAAESGKTVYRYSKTPWLHDGKMMNTIQKLGGFAAVAPAAFIMGVDDTGFFGAGRAVNEATAGDEANQAQAVADTNAPGAELAGQALGVLAPWTATSKLWNFIGGGGAGLAARAGGGLLARTAAAGGAAAVAAGADQAVREGAHALSGEGFDLGQSGARIGAAMNPLQSPLAPALGAAGELVGSVAKAGADWTRDRAYGGSIGRMERNGTEFRFGRGPSLTPGAKEAVREGQALDADTIDAPAERLAKPLEEGASKIRADKAEEIGARNEPFYGSREGRMLLPVSNVVDVAAKKLRQQYAKRASGRMEPIASETGAADINKFRNILNEQLAGVSTKPSKSAIAISPEEAQEFLSASNRQSLMPKAPPKESSSGAREVDLSNPSVGEKEPEGLAASLRARGVDKVYLLPKRLTAKDHETLIHKYNPKITTVENGVEKTYVDRDKAEIQQAAYRDRDVRPMNGEPGGWSAAQRKAREELRQAEDIQKRVGRGDQAFHSAVQYGNQGPGQLLNMRALQAAADKSGVRNQLDAARALDPWKKLQKAMTPGAATGDGNALGFTGAAMRLGHVAGAYPIAKGLESPLGPIRGGTAGRFSLLGRNSLAMPVEEEEQK